MADDVLAWACERRPAVPGSWTSAMRALLRLWGAPSGSQRASVTFEGDLDTPVGCPA